ncbi:MAG: response regulator transcription factor [Bacteroidota bacterium]
MLLEGIDVTPVPLTRLKVLIADDHKFFRLGLKSTLQEISYIKTIAEASNGDEVLQLMKKVTYDLIFLDIQMPGLDGVQTLRTLRLTNGYTRVIALSMHTEEKYIHDMYEGKVNGFLRKETEKEEVVRAIENVMGGEPYYTPIIREVLFNVLVKKDRYLGDLSTETRMIRLTAREEDILKMICQQYSSAEIAKRLYIAEDTVKGHRLRLLDKTKAKNVAGMVVYAIKHGIYRVG